MKKQRYFTYFILLFVLLGAGSCTWLNIENKLFPCQSYVPQSHKFGHFVAHVNANKAILQPGDTIFLTVKMNQQFYDSLTRQAVQVQQKVALFVKLANALGPINSGNFFATDTTIYRVFDQYFTTRVVTGSKNTAYDFDCRLHDGFWELELQYIALKKGRYDLAVSFKEIQTGEPALPTGVCMVGDADVFGAQIQLNTLNNQVRRVYPTLAVSSNDLFGFRTCWEFKNWGIVSSFVATKLQRSDQTVFKTDRSPMGCNFSFFTTKTQTNPRPSPDNGRTFIHATNWLTMA